MERFTVGQEIANFLISCGILSKAWEESDVARDSGSFNLTEHEGVTYVTFPSFHKIEGFIVEEGEYGLGNIQTNNQIFSEGLMGNDGKPALVHQGALTLFLRIMEKTDFQAKLQVYTDSKQRDLKPIIFVGHSLGGAVATLATLWILRKRLRQSSPFCITFGCPLVGNETLVEAVGRENWGGKFLHVISQHDIVPRMLLAPLKSIAQPLTAILPYWHGQIRYSFIQDACNTLLENLMQCTYTVENYGADSFSRLDEVIQNAGNTLLENDVDSSAGSDGAIKRSPYKPFGIYLFCSSNGAACIDNSETVLNMLHLTMPSRENLSDYMVQECISEHIAYGSVLKHVIENSVSGRRIDNSNSESAYEMGISMQLDAVDVRCQNGHKWIFSPITGNIENHLDENAAKLSRELPLTKCGMAELEWYKESCEKNGGIGYYESAKQFDIKHIRADRRRQKLAEFWDEVVEMWESHELPSDFETQDKWINAGNTYRRMVEPLDIAHYYRYTTGKGNYLSDGRPRRHTVLQQWMEAKEKTRSSRSQRIRTKPASLTEDSCFWAYVEEAWKDLENLKQGQHQSLQCLEEFEKYVTTMNNALCISVDVFFVGNRFMRWWEEWERYKRDHLPESESPPKFERNDSLTVRQENISSTGEAKDSIPSNKEVNDSIPSNKESDLAQPSSKESELIPQQGCSLTVGQEKIYCTGEIKDRFPSNKESDLALDRMCELERYKMICHEKDDAYYDSFKNRNDNDNSNLLRAALNEFWDGIIEYCNSPSLLSDFQSRKRWINDGTLYRKLVEPLDIAEYYRTSKDSGNYLDKRPARYKVLEQWLEHRKTNRSSRDQRSRTKLPFLTQDSCFWARVEEALKDLKEGADQKKESLENFEKYVTEMINDCKISSDVLLKGSSFMKWWGDYKEHQTSEWKLKSPLYKLESPFWNP